MIGCYVHHHGRGHLHRARAVVERLAERGEATTVLSSLPAPPGWPGAWVALPLDVDDSPPRDATAGGALHWAPLDQPGLRARMSRISSWLELARPSAVLCDVSQEVALLCRLHGVPVVSVLQPGRRTDTAHVTGLRAATALVAPWPAAATGLLPGLPADLAGRLVPVGAVTRAVPREVARVPAPVVLQRPLRVVVLGGAGGDAWTADQVTDLRRRLPADEVTVLGPGGTWVADPEPLLRSADVVVTHAGQNAVAEVAAARVPAVVVPGERPFDEQRVTAQELHDGPWPVVALDRLEHDDWPALLRGVAALDGAAWAPWCDGAAADRLADVLVGVGAPCEVPA